MNIKHSREAVGTIKVLIRDLKMGMLMGKEKSHVSLNKSCSLYADLFLNSHYVLVYFLQFSSLRSSPWLLNTIG